MPSIVSVGEVMLELSAIQANGSAHLGVGGDTGNTAVYLSRLLGEAGSVSYLTRLGQGPFAEQISDFLSTEGITISPFASAKAGTPGLYAISTDDEGERSFTYWRTSAAVRELFEGDLGKEEVEFAQQHDALYVSGITLAVLSDEGRTALFELAEWFQKHGRTVMYDVNHRSHLWSSHAPEVDFVAANLEMIKRSSIVKIGRDEGEALFDLAKSEDVATFVCDKGAAGVVVTDGPDGLFVRFDGKLEAVDFPAISKIVDSTAAGDSFSAGYLNAYLAGLSPAECARAGQDLAGRVIQFPGAIMPKSEMP